MSGSDSLIPEADTHTAEADTDDIVKVAKTITLLHLGHFFSVGILLIFY